MAQFTYDMAAEAVDAGVPDGLTDRSGGAISYSVIGDWGSPSGKAIQLSGGMATSVNRYATWDALGQKADVEVLAMVRATADGVAEAGIHLFARADSTQDDLYALRAEPDRDGFRMYYGTAASEYTGLNLGAGPAWTDGVVVAVRWRIVGTQLQSRIWTPFDNGDITADEPGTWDATITDANISAANFVGIGGRQVGADQKLLYLSATDSPSTESAPAPAITTANTMKVRVGSSWVEKTVYTRDAGSWS